MSRDGGGRRRDLSAEERALWKTVSKSYKPLRARKDKTIDGGGIDADEPPPPKKSKPVVRSEPAKPVRAAPAQPPAPDLAPLGRRMKSRVARGREAIDARLDLHGHTQDEAHAALLRFLRNASARGHRLVLVITGKGRAGGEMGVLRRQVPQWLGLAEFRALVIGYEQAHIAHGGEGALYVRVRRSRGD